MNMDRLQRWLSAWEAVLWLSAFGCAGFLTLAILWPIEMARTSWSQWQRNQGTVIVDSPAGYVGLLSLCGFITLVCLIFAHWSWRRTPLAVLCSAMINLIAVYVTVTYATALSRGEALVDGSGSMGPDWTVHWPLLLPVFVLAAITGFLCALGLTMRWRQLRSLE